MTDDRPTDEGPAEQEFIDRRSGTDRRSGRERRRAGRRHRRLDVDEDRRAGTDRRKGQRRSGTDRRIFQDPRYRKPRPKDVAPSVYTAEQAGRIQRMVSRVGQAAACPVCGGGFSLGPVQRRGADTVRQIGCADCGRSTVVTNAVVARVMVLTGVDPLRRLLHGTLTGAGHEVILPPHTGHALELYRENPADVVVMDTYALAEMDGREFIRRLRREFAEPRILVIAPRVQYGAADPSATATQLGATHIIRAPFSRMELLQAVRDART